MPARVFSVVLPAIVALGVGGVWAGSALSALPPPPTVSLPTVTVPLPPPPVPVPAPPAVTVPPKVEAPPPLPPPPASPPPIDAPVELSPAPAPAPPSAAPGLRGGGMSPVHRVSGRPTRSKPSTRPTPTPKGDRAAVVPAVRAGSPADGAKGVVATASTSVQGPVPEGAGFFGPISSAFNALDIPAEVIPPALFAMAALAILLLALASAPLPARTSRAGATIVHMRGSIAVAGTAALMMALGTYLLL